MDKGRLIEPEKKYREVGRTTCQNSEEETATTTNLLVVATQVKKKYQNFRGATWLRVLVTIVQVMLLFV